MNKHSSKILWSYIFLGNTKSCFEEEAINRKMEKITFSSKYDHRNYGSSYPQA